MVGVCQLCASGFFRSRQPERPRVPSAREEPDELFAGCPSDPVVHAAILVSKVRGAAEHGYVRNLPARHLDDELVGASGVALEGRLVLTLRKLLHFASHLEMDGWKLWRGVRRGLLPQH